MIYVVSGFMRTGTSMMMACLEAGGIPAVFNSDRDTMNTRFGDKHYKPNEGGFYELKRHQYFEPGFPQMHGDHVVKILWGGLNRVCVGEHKYKIVFMYRHPEEIRQSFEAFFGNNTPLVCERTMEPDAPYYAAMKVPVNIAKQRRDIELVEFNYRDVVREPRIAFDALVNDGWPIDPEAAAAIVDSKLCRFRLENLAVAA